MKNLFTFAILAMSFMIVMAQQQHSVSTKVTSFKLASSKDGLTYSYQYDDQDRISMINVKTTKESYDISATYEDELFTAKYTQYGSVITFNYSIQDDRVVKETVNVSSVNGSVDFNVIEYSYDDDNRLEKISSTSQVEPAANCDIELIWQDGNVTSATISGQSTNATLTFDYYTDLFDRTIVQGLSGYLATIFDETGVISLSPIFICENFFGKLGANLLKSIKRVGSSSKEGSFNKTIDLTYTFTDKGLVQKCNYGSKVHEYTWDASASAHTTYKLTYIVDGETYASYDVEYGAAITPEAIPSKDGYVFSGWSEIPETMPNHDVTVYATFTVGIDNVLSSQPVKYIYSPAGILCDKLQKGINVVVTSDGTRKKVIVR